MCTTQATAVALSLHPSTSRNAQTILQQWYRWTGFGCQACLHSICFSGSWDRRLILWMWRLPRSCSSPSMTSLDSALRHSTGAGVGKQRPTAGMRKRALGGGGDAGIAGRDLRLRGERARRVLTFDLEHQLEKGQEQEPCGGGRLGAWISLGVTVDELCLALTLPTGQTFRWRKTGDAEYTGVVGAHLVSLRQTDRDVEFLLHPPAAAQISSGCNCSCAKTELTCLDVLVPGREVGGDVEAVLQDYLNLHTSLKDLWTGFEAADDRFAAVAPYMSGARLLRQDPLECVFQFICSSNNHLQRITGMVDHLASLGTYLGTVKGFRFYQFPTLEQLASVKETALREAGFGYRAKFIVGAAEVLLQKDGGRDWLLSLRKASLPEAVTALCTLPGVGPKVAACIALFSLDQHHAVPVDTHVWQIAVRYLMPELAGERLTPKLHQDVAQAFVTRFGKYAGWAHTVLFIAELSSQRDLLPERLRAPRVTRVKVKSNRKATPKVTRN